jgi:hypothetical protein
VHTVQHTLQGRRNRRRHTGIKRRRPLLREQKQHLAPSGIKLQRTGQPLQHFIRRRPPRPCSNHVYQATLTLARVATSSRLRPGVRRRPWASGPGCRRDLRSRRKLPKEATGSGRVLTVITVYASSFYSPKVLREMCSLVPPIHSRTHKAVRTCGFATGATGLIGEVTLDEVITAEPALPGLARSTAAGPHRTPARLFACLNKRSGASA